MAATGADGLPRLPELEVAASPLLTLSRTTMRAADAMGRVKEAIVRCGRVVSRDAGAKPRDNAEVTMDFDAMEFKAPARCI